VLEYACAADDPATLGVALAHIEKALDRLSVGMLKAAHAVTVGHGPAGESSLEPSAQALYFHLRLTSERLREPLLACQAGRSWTRRLVTTGDARAMT